VVIRVLTAIVVTLVEVVRQDRGLIMKNKFDKFSDMSIKRLKDIAQDCFHSIYISECFGSKDCINYTLACNELNKRGYDINEDRNIHIEKRIK